MTYKTDWAGFALRFSPLETADLVSSEEYIAAGSTFAVFLTTEADVVTAGSTVAVCLSSEEYIAAGSATQFAVVASTVAAI